MPDTTNKVLSTAKTSNKNKDNIAEINRIMEEAPLFAGLDGFILMKPEITIVEAKKKETKGRKLPKEEKQTKPPVPEKLNTRQKPLKTVKPPSSEAAHILLSVKEMCGLLKISRATLVRMDKSGQLPGRIKLGGSVRFHRETVETWLKSLISPQSTPY